MRDNEKRREEKRREEKRREEKRRERETDLELVSSAAHNAVAEEGGATGLRGLCSAVLGGEGEALLIISWQGVWELES